MKCSWLTTMDWAEGRRGKEGSEDWFYWQMNALTFTFVHHLVVCSIEHTTIKPPYHNQRATAIQLGYYFSCLLNHELPCRYTRVWIHEDCMLTVSLCLVDLRWLFTCPVASRCSIPTRWTCHVEVCVSVCVSSWEWGGDLRGGSLRILTSKLI